MVAKGIMEKLSVRKVTFITCLGRGWNRQLLSKFYGFFDPYKYTTSFSKHLQQVIGDFLTNDGQRLHLFVHRPPPQRLPMAQLSFEYRTKLGTKPITETTSFGYFFINTTFPQAGTFPQKYVSD